MRPYSWSQHSSFRDYDKEKWYQSYVLGIREPSNPRMDFGKRVGTRLETDPTYIPQIPRHTMEYGIGQEGNECKLGKIALVGFMDSYDPDKKIISEFKTSSANGWNQDKVDDSYKSGGQLTFYCLLLLLKENISPEDITIKLYHLVTQEGGDFSISFKSPFTINIFETKRTTSEVLKFGASIIKQRKEMEKYILDH